MKQSTDQAQLKQIVRKLGKCGRYHTRTLNGYSDHILIQKEGKHLPKVLTFKFQIHFEVIHFQNKFDKQNYWDPFKFIKGFDIYNEQKRVLSITIRKNEQPILIKWVQYLQSKINQKGFHQYFTIDKKLTTTTLFDEFSGVRHQDGKIVLIKAYSKKQLQSQPNEYKYLAEEMEILRQLDNEYIIKLYSIQETDNSIYIIIDKYSEYSLQDYINQNMQLQDIQKILLKLINGLIYLKSQQIMVRNITVSNLFFKSSIENLDIIFTDFRLATKTNINPIPYPACGTAGFIAYEVINYKKNSVYNEKCDIFSLGLVFNILLTGKSIFVQSGTQQLLMQNKLCQFYFSSYIYSNIDEDALNLLQNMLIIDPQLRFSAEECLSHEFFNKNYLKAKLSLELQLDNILPLNQQEDQQQIKFEQEIDTASNIEQIQEQKIIRNLDPFITKVETKLFNQTKEIQTTYTNSIKTIVYISYEVNQSSRNLFNEGKNQQLATKPSNFINSNNNNNNQQQLKILPQIKNKISSPQKNNIMAQKGIPPLSQNLKRQTLIIKAPFKGQFNNSASPIRKIVKRFD